MCISQLKTEGGMQFMQYGLFGYCLALYIPAFQRGSFYCIIIHISILLHYQLPYRIAIARGVLQQVLAGWQVVL